MAKIEFKTRYNHNAPRTFAFTCEGESFTQQQFKDECDVNNILAKYKKTNMLTHINKYQGNYGDFSNIQDYQSSLSKVLQAQDSFNALPSNIRNKFSNNPGNLIEFISDPKNVDEAIQLGLMVKPPKENPPLIEVFEAALENHSKKQQTKT